MLEEASDGVRLMTVHGAKGLEFPVVILADMTANLAARESERFVAGPLCATRLLNAAPWELLEHEQHERTRELAEGVRVAYVAATRARDLLVIPGVGDEEREGWLGPLNKAIYPAREQRRAQASATGCPSFAGDRTVLARPGEHPGQLGGIRAARLAPAAIGRAPGGLVGPIGSAVGCRGRIRPAPGGYSGRRARRARRRRHRAL